MVITYWMSISSGEIIIVLGNGITQISVLYTFIFFSFSLTSVYLPLFLQWTICVGGSLNVELHLKCNRFYCRRLLAGKLDLPYFYLLPFSSSINASISSAVNAVIQAGGATL